MAKKSYHVVDSSGKKVGFLALAVAATPQETTSLFESIAPTFDTVDVPKQTRVVKTSIWQSDGVNAIIIGIFTGTVILSYSLVTDSGLGLLAAVAAIATGCGAYALKLWWHKPSAQPITAGSEAGTVIKVESWSEDNAHVEIDYIEDDTIKAAELRRVAAAVCENDMQWLGRRKMCNLANLSQPKYFRIRDELIRLNYLYPDAGNNTAIGLRGKSFLRQLASLPYQQS